MVGQVNMRYRRLLVFEENQNGLGALDESRLWPLCLLWMYHVRV